MIKYLALATMLLLGACSGTVKVCYATEEGCQYTVWSGQVVSGN